MYKVEIIEEEHGFKLQSEVNKFLNEIGDKYVSSSISISDEGMCSRRIAMITYKKN